MRSNIEAISPRSVRSSATTSSLSMEIVVWLLPPRCASMQRQPARQGRPLAANRIGCSRRLLRPIRRRDPEQDGSPAPCRTRRSQCRQWSEHTRKTALGRLRHLRTDRIRAVNIVLKTFHETKTGVVTDLTEHPRRRVDVQCRLLPPVRLQEPVA